MSEQSQQTPPSQIHRELLGVLGLSPFDAYDSASRKQMFASHISQALVIEGSTERFIQTGMEREYGKYTFNVKMPVDAEIIQVIQRYPRTIDESSIGHNPETLIIYEDVETKEVGCLSLVDYFSHHQYFGFAYQRRTGVLNKLRAGEFIKKGEILLDSPSVTEQGGYKYGRECNVAFMSHPAVAEDGFIVSRDLLPKFRFKTYETRVVEWGSKHYPLNLYGDELTYKPHPDIGDLVRADGVLMALRPHSENFAPVEMSVRRTREIDAVFDTCYYAAGPGEVKDNGHVISGRVIDIRVMHDPESAVPTTPVGMEAQTKRYNDARLRYYQQIYSTYQTLKRTRQNKLNITHEFNRLVVEAISVLGAIKPMAANKESPERVSKLHRGIPLDDWRVEFVIEYTVEPTIGFKLTDTHGGKGVICHIAEPHEMPVDEAGNRADIVVDPNARVSRMNIGGMYEPYINAASRDLAKELRRKLVGSETVPMGWAIKADEATIAHCWERLLGYIRIVTPHTAERFASFDAKKAASYLEHVVKEGMVYLYFPPDNQAEGMQIVTQLEAAYAPTYGPVSYIGYSGNRCTTVNNVRIGSMYIMLLEKTGDDWTAVSSGKWQNFGVLAQINNRDKYTQPTRNQAIRAWGETETRIATAYAGPIMASEILDRNNNMLSHKQTLHAILNATRPTDIVNSVDRSINPLGNARPLQLVKHYAMCGGWQFHYSPHQVDAFSGLTQDADEIVQDLKEKGEID